MKNKRNICVVTGSRAEYGILKPVLKAIKENPTTNLFLVVAGMHLSPRFGFTVEEIKKDGFKVDAKVDMLLSEDSAEKMAHSIGIGIIGFTYAFEKLQPDILIVFGDREEPFAATISAMCLGIPIAHLSGGDVATGGNIDESIRHALTKISHLHLPFSKSSAKRIEKMGEELWRIKKVGLPSIDTIMSQKPLSLITLSKKFSVDFSKPLIIVVQHPLAIDWKNSGKHMQATLEAIKELSLQTILIYPNSDPGSEKMIKVIKKYQKHSFIHAHKSISHHEYLSLMKLSSVMVGNSSSGILEAPSLKIPSINIGLRQNGREQATNIINVNHNKEQIKKAIQKAVYDKKFRKKVLQCKNPYGDGKSSKRIVRILSNIKIDNKLLHKKITY
jgi:GDP/UDP-N,N'-diacetylbacillosamine 2-epimerase (hydrolysing)